MKNETNGGEQQPVEAASRRGSAEVERQVRRVKATWSASLDCECPSCGEDVDLMDEPDFWDGRGDLEIAQEVKGLQVWCPKCGHEFEVDTVW